MIVPGGVVGAPVVVPAVPPGLAELWIAVTAAGGAAGFTTYTPDAEIVTAARAAETEVAEGHAHLVALLAGDTLAGTVFLQPGSGERFGHSGVVKQFLVHPELQGRGFGAALLDAAARHARALGLELLRLACRGGTDLPAYYTRRGWTEVGRFPGALRFRDGERRDEHWFQLSLLD